MNVDTLGRRRAADKILSDLTKRNWDVLLTTYNDAGNLWQLKIARRISDIGQAVIVPFGRCLEGDYLMAMEFAEKLVDEFEQSICGAIKRVA